jgi:hypothetical protein
MNSHRVQSLFHIGQKLFLNNQRPCFLYLLDEAMDFEFVRSTLRARDSRRLQVDEQAGSVQGDYSARFGFAWVDIPELFRDVESGSKPFSRWAREFLLGFGEANMTAQLNNVTAERAQAQQAQSKMTMGPGGGDNFHYSGGPAANAEMMVPYQMMNGSAMGMGMYDGSASGIYMDPGMHFMQTYPQPPPHPHHPHHQHPYFYPQPPQPMMPPQYTDYGHRQGPHQQPLRGATGSGSAGQLRFRFPAHVLSLDVRTTGPRLHRDRIISIGVALLTIQTSGTDPQV